MALSLSQYLQSRSTSESVVTHTRIPDLTKGIYPGKFNIQDDDLGAFFKAYHHFVFGPNPMPEYLTEKQRDCGPLAVDLDFRYHDNERVYTSAHVELFIDMTMEELQNMFTEIPFEIDVYVMEKPKVNDTGPVIKDGLHILFGVNLDKTVKEMLRKRMLGRIGALWEDLAPRLTNNWDSVIDKGVMIGSTGWQLYGSKKPGHEAYRITSMYKTSIESGAPLIAKYAVPAMTAAMLPKVSVRYQEYETLDNLRVELNEEYDNIRSGLARPRQVVNLVDRTMATVSDLSTVEKVDQELARLFETLGISNNYVKETFDFAMVLPEPYYDTYDKWIRVGWALKNTDERLFVGWVKFSSKSEKFNFSDVDDMRAKWNSWVKKMDGESLTCRSVAYWALNTNRVGYNQVISQSANKLVDEIIKCQTPTEYDLAMLLYTCYKDKFVCVSIKNKCWFAFENHRWVETDSGSNLRLQISQSIYTMFVKKLQEAMDIVPTDKDAADAHKRKVQKISAIMLELKSHTKKMNIMKEAADLFYIPKFIDKLDSKPFILGCLNGVIDFEDPLLFRDGKPDDYVSKSTLLDYIPVGEEQAEIVAEIETFFEQLFPNGELRSYMWDHMASLLIGKNQNQTINFYTGVGRNGKSAFVDLLSLLLGTYKAVVPVSLITQKRTGVGSSSSEVAQLQGIRYAVMQEPSKGDRINEGIMKELTGGDPLQARALYKDSVTFEVNFKLVMCANDLPDIKSGDWGTWRRIRVCHFMSLFCETPNQEDASNPYQFTVDKNINQKFKRWCGVLLAMLVKRAAETKGMVNDCEFVLSKSNEYRNEQDVFSEFARLVIKVDPTGAVPIKDLNEAFIDWWKQNHSADVRSPNLKELYMYLDRCRLGQKVKPPDKNIYWKGISLIVDSSF